MKIIFCLLLSSALYAFAGVEQKTQPIQAIETQAPAPIEQGKKTLPIETEAPAPIEQGKKTLPIETEAPKAPLPVLQQQAPAPIEQGKGKEVETPKMEQQQTPMQQESPKQESSKQESPKQETPMQQQTQQQTQQQAEPTQKESAKQLPEAKAETKTSSEQVSPKQGKSWNDLAIESNICTTGTMLCEVTRFNTLTETSFTENVCFDPSTHFCAKREDGVVPGNLLCPINFPKLCGYQCFNPATFTCVVHEALCPVEAPELCGSDCFNKKFYECKNGRLNPLDSTQVDMFAGLSHSLTGCNLMTCITTIPFTNEEYPRCFDPAMNTCADREGKLDHGALLCPITHPAACRDHCYDSSRYVCHVESSLCPTSAPKLCGEDCFDPALWKCVDDILFPLGVPALKPLAIEQGEKGSGVVAQQQPVQEAVTQDSKKPEAVTQDSKKPEAVLNLPLPVQAVEKAQPVQAVQQPEPVQAVQEQKPVQPVQEQPIEADKKKGN